MGKKDIFCPGRERGFPAPFSLCINFDLFHVILVRCADKEKGEEKRGPSNTIKGETPPPIIRLG